MFWENFVRLCEQVGTKPNPVGKEIGVSSGVITKWKNGTIPNGETLIRLADYLDCSIDYLLGRVNTPKEITAPIQMDKGGSNIMLLAGRDGNQIKIQLNDEQYNMVYKMFCSFPDADNPEL